MLKVYLATTSDESGCFGTIAVFSTREKAEVLAARFLAMKIDEYEVDCVDPSTFPPAPAVPWALQITVFDMSGPRPYVPPWQNGGVDYPHTAYVHLLEDPRDYPSPEGISWETVDSFYPSAAIYTRKVWANSYDDAMKIAQEKLVELAGPRPTRPTHVGRRRKE